MKNIPDIDAISAKIIELIEENTEPPNPLRADAPLVAELGLESLDVIEMGFSVQETFNFDFSDLNPVEELDKALGGGRLIQEGRITPEGRKVVLQRMPELEGVALPEELTIHKLQSYYTVSTFARLIHEWYQVLPDDIDGDPVILFDFQPKTQTGQDVPLPKADDLVHAWVKRQLKAMGAES